MDEKGIDDLVIVGGGLSGSRLVIELLDALLADTVGHPRRVMKIVMLDRLGAFGGGIPYGRATTQPGFLLIETVAVSTPPEFQEWLRANRSALSEAAQSDDPALSAWANANEAPIAEGKLDGLFVPRRVFGQFVAEQLHAKVALARSRGIATVRMVEGEAMDVEPGAPLRVSLAGGRSALGNRVVLATGCVPKRNDSGLGLEDGYIHEPYGDALRGLKSVVLMRSMSSGGPLDVLVVGSSASASEVLFALAHSADLLARVRAIQIVSVSGYLAGGAVGLPPAPHEKGALAYGRPSAREYIQAATLLVSLGKLSAARGDVTYIRRSDPPQIERPVRGRPSRLEVGITAADGPRTLTADVVVNCAGVGRVDRTDSPLLQRLAASGRPFKPNACRRGFELRPGSYEVDGVDGCFVLGPLLNQDPLETQVESIHAVYRAAGALAKGIYARWQEGR